MTLTLDQVIGIAGLLVGAVAVIYAVKLDQKLKTAQEAERQIEKKFMHYIAAQEFRDLAAKAGGITGNIRSGDWVKVTELADDIGPALSVVRGAHNPLLGSLEKDKLDVAATNFQMFIDSLPLAGREEALTEEQIRIMVPRCRQLV